MNHPTTCKFIGCEVCLSYHDERKNFLKGICDVKKQTNLRDFDVFGFVLLSEIKALAQSFHEKFLLYFFC
jgi:hypothetical protein